LFVVKQNEQGQKQDFSGKGGGGAGWYPGVAESMGHAPKMLQYLRTGTLMKTVTLEVLAIRQS